MVRDPLAREGNVIYQGFLFHCYSLPDVFHNTVRLRPATGPAVGRMMQATSEDTKNPNRAVVPNRSAAVTRSVGAPRRSAALPAGHRD